MTELAELLGALLGLGLFLRDALSLRAGALLLFLALAQALSLRGALSREGLLGELGGSARGDAAVIALLPALPASAAVRSLLLIALAAAVLLLAASAASTTLGRHGSGATYESDLKRRKRSSEVNSVLFCTAR